MCANAAHNCNMLLSLTHHGGRALFCQRTFPEAGLFERVEINRMRQGQWHPEAAPKTAEGN